MTLCKGLVSNTWMTES